MADEVVVTGLRELRTSLRALDRNLPKGIRVAGNKAADVVITGARPRVPIGPGRGGHAASSIRKASTQSAVRVREGGARYPYMPWLDFGGTINKHTDHPTERPFIRKGRFVWAAFDDHKQLVLDTYERELETLARDAGLDPH